MSQLLHDCALIPLCRCCAPHFVPFYWLIVDSLFSCFDAHRLLEEDDETYFGPLVRTLKPGSTFGELSLLQKTANRTASVLVPAPAEPEEEGQGNQVKEEEAKEEAKVTKGGMESCSPP